MAALNAFLGNMVTKAVTNKKAGFFGNTIGRIVDTRQQNQLDSLTSAPKMYSSQRSNPESRFATRALGDKSDLGITDSLALGASPPTMRTLDDLLEGKYASLLNISGRFYK